MSFLPLLGYTAVALACYIHHQHIDWESIYPLGVANNKPKPMTHTSPWEDPSLTILGAWLVALCLLTRLCDKISPFVLRFAFMPTLLSTLTLIWVIDAESIEAEFMNPQHGVAVALAMLAGVFSFVPFKEFLRRLWANPRAVVVAAFGVAAPFLYAQYKEPLWLYTSGVTVLGVEYLLKLFGIMVDAKPYFTNVNFLLQLANADFQFTVWAICSGMEGVFLTVFALSVCFLYDWALFRRLPLWPFYLVSVIAIFAVNMVRLALLFRLGVYLKHNTNPYITSQLIFDGTHSLLGMGLYFVVILLIVDRLYHVAMRWGKKAD